MAFRPRDAPIGQDRDRALRLPVQPGALHETPRVNRRWAREPKNGPCDRGGLDYWYPASAALGLTGTEQSLIPTSALARACGGSKHRSFVVQHQMHPAELELFDTTGRMTGTSL